MRFVFFVLSSLAAAAASAQESPPATGEVLVVPGPLQALISYDSTDPNAGAPGAPAGWHLPGTSFTADANWYALVCAKECALHATRLDVAPATHAVYDGEPVASQLLHWSPLPDGLDRVIAPDAVAPTLIALLRPGAKLKLAAGPVPTWLHSGMKQYPATDRPGTMETSIPTGGNEPVMLVPRVANVPSGNLEDHDTTVEIELRIGARRQRLGTYTFGIDGAVPLRGPDYLVWAGDLDHDGKPDLIVRLGSDREHVVLYLSTFAKPGELVGAAGDFDYYDPSAAGC